MKPVPHSQSPVVVYRTQRTGSEPQKELTSCVCSVPAPPALIYITHTIHIWVQKLFPSLSKWNLCTGFIGPGIICCSSGRKVRTLTPKWKCSQVNLATIFSFTGGEERSNRLWQQPGHFKGCHRPWNVHHVQLWLGTSESCPQRNSRCCVFKTLFQTNFRFMRSTL